jgi:CHAD domain-containing protein
MRTMTLNDDPNIVKGASSGKMGWHPAMTSSARPIGAEDPDKDVPPPMLEAHLVHEMRKTIKRMRALARLLRYELGQPELDRINDSLRAAGRRLASERDAEVRLTTLEDLRDRHPKTLATVGIARLHELLEDERARAGRSPNSGELLEDIAFMRHTLASWRRLDADLETIAPGLRRIYREGRRRYSRVRRKHAENTEIHDWRKRVKALYYALDMLGGSQTGRACATTMRAERLGDMLGEEHDLWMLAVYVKEHTAALGEDGSARTLAAAIERRRKRLRKRALGLGARMYAHKAGDFTRRISKRLAD